jgi:hypothetical protein
MKASTTDAKHPFNVRFKIASQQLGNATIKASPRDWLTEDVLCMLFQGVNPACFRFPNFWQRSQYFKEYCEVYTKTASFLLGRWNEFIRENDFFEDSCPLSKLML